MKERRREGGAIFLTGWMKKTGRGWLREETRRGARQSRWLHDFSVFLATLRLLGCNLLLQIEEYFSFLWYGAHISIERKK